MKYVIMEESVNAENYPVAVLDSEEDAGQFCLDKNNSSDNSIICYHYVEV